MKLTPAQAAMHAFLGGWLPRGMSGDWSMAQRIKFGHDLLKSITRQDFGYDALRWHDYLWDNDAGGYRWTHRSRAKWARVVQSAISKPDWQQAVHELQTNSCRPAGD